MSFFENFGNQLNDQAGTKQADAQLALPLQADGAFSEDSSADIATANGAEKQKVASSEKCPTAKAGGLEFMQPGTFSENFAQFLSLISARQGSMVKRGEKGAWKQTSRYHILTDEEIVESVEGESDCLRACRSDVATGLAAVILEPSSYYRTKEGMVKLRKCLEFAGLSRLKLYRACADGEWQLVIFFQKPVNSATLSDLLSSWMRRHGIVAGTNGVHIFPGPEDKEPQRAERRRTPRREGLLTIPLQPGFAFLNPDGNEIASRDQISVEAAMAIFVSDVATTAVDGEALTERLRSLIADAQ